MTSQEFFAYVQSHPYQTSVWYGEIAPPYEIRAIAIPLIDNSGQDISSYLGEVMQIVLPLPSGGTVALNIVDRQIISNSAGACYFFNVTYVTVPSLTAVTESNASLTFLPAIDQSDFYDSPYNVLQGSVQGIRTSTYIMQSDRYKIGTLANPTYTGPLNIDALLSGSAPLADVQDSNYTTVGWVNARYEGSKTDREDFKTDPATAGSIFEGAEYPTSITIPQISYLKTSNQVIYKDYFYAGTGDIPGFYPLPSGYMLTSSAPITDTETLIYITPDGYSSTLLPVPKIGNLIRLDSEIMKINQVGTINTTWLRYALTVTRGWTSNTGSHSNYTTVENVSQVQVYNITGNKLTGVPKGQVLVKQTGTVVKLDNLGYIVSSSTLS